MNRAIFLSLLILFSAVFSASDDILVQEVDENDQPIGKPYVPSRQQPKEPQQSGAQAAGGPAPQTHSGYGQSLPTSGVISNRLSGKPSDRGSLAPARYNSLFRGLNPWQQIASLERELDLMNRMFGDFLPYQHPLQPFFEPLQALQDPLFASPSALDLARTVSDLTPWRPVMDVVERADALVFHSELPGVKKEDVEINLRGGDTLVISGKRASRREIGEKGTRFHSVESSSGTFSRSFRLPANTDKDNIKAEFNDGILDVVVPKKVAKVPDRKIEL